MSRLNTLAIVAVVGAVLAAYASTKDTSTSSTTDDTDTVSVTYHLFVPNGSLYPATADLTYTDGSGNIQQSTGQPVPIDGTSDTTDTDITIEAEHGQYLSMSAQESNGDWRMIVCVIIADGEVVNTGHSFGAFAISTCSGRVP
jgi:hypothetical protein